MMKCILATLSLILVAATADASIDSVLADLKSEVAALKDDYQSKVAALKHEHHALEDSFKALEDEHRALERENRVLKNEITLLGESRNNEAPKKSLRKLNGKSGKSKSDKRGETSFCYADDGMTVDLEVIVEESRDDEDSTVGTVEYGIIDVKDGETIVVDATVSSDAMVYYEMLEVPPNVASQEAKSELFMSVRLYEGCTKTPCGSGKLITPTPSNTIQLHGLKNENRETFLARTYSDVKSQVTSNGKFYFHDLEEGPHLLEVVFELYVGVRIDSPDCSAGKMAVDTFVIQVDRMDAESMKCDLDVETGLRLL